MPRLPQGDLVNRTYIPGQAGNSRTPLAEAYDVMADLVVQEAIKARGGWVARLIRSPPFPPLDKGGLTANERAFIQALYYHRRIYRHGRPYYVYDELGRRFENPNPHRTHALQVEWVGPRVRDRRLVRIRVWRIGEASLHAAETYR